MKNNTREVILIINSLNDERITSLIENIPNKSNYSFILSSLSNNLKTKIAHWSIYPVNRDTLFQQGCLYYLNDDYHLNELIYTLTNINEVHLFVIITSQLPKNIDLKKNDMITVILDRNIYANGMDTNLPIDYVFDWENINDFFYERDNLESLFNKIQRKYRISFEESNIIKKKILSYEMKINSLTNVIDLIKEAVIIIKPNGTIKYVNIAFTYLTGQQKHEVVGNNWWKLFNNDALAENYPQIMKNMHSGKDYQLKVTIKGKNDNEYILEFLFSPLFNSQNQLEEVLVIIDDVSANIIKNMIIESLKYQDSITDIWNRQYFIKEVNNLLNYVGNSNIGIVLMDLSTLKEVNNTLGYQFGDMLIQEVANRVNNILKPENIFSRFYCDEFIFIVPNINSQDDVISIVKNINNNFNNPFIIENQAIYAKFTSGICIYPKHGKTFEELIKNAEATLYTAKKRNVDYLIYDNSMRELITNRLEIENNIHNGIKNQEFTLYYQPIIDIKTGKMTAVETLLRWHSKDKGVLSPIYFLDIIEKSGQIIQIGENTMRDALYKFRKFEKHFSYPLNISFNLSTKQLLNDTIVENFTKIINETNFNPKQLMFEITEDITAEAIQNTKEIFNTFNSIGVSFCMDDFGTGYSSLGQLKNYPIKKIKIDKVFIDKMEEDTDYQSMLKGIIALSHSMGYKVVAEGVETRNQLELLRQYHCDEIQGYYVCKPIPFEELDEIVKKNNGYFIDIL